MGRGRRRVNGRKLQSKGEGGSSSEEGGQGPGDARRKTPGAGAEGDGAALSAQALTPLGLGVISTLLSILLPPPPLGSGVPVATRGASLLTSGALRGLAERMRCPLAQWMPGHRAQRPRSAALQPRAPPSSLRSQRRFLLPFLQTLLPFSRQQNLRSRLFVRQRKGGQGPGEGGDGLCLWSQCQRAIAVKREKS